MKSNLRIHRRAFTVPELLAVVAIIMIIISILMPSLVKARRITYIAICASNQHQIGIAQQNYLIDSRNIYPTLFNWGDLVGQKGATAYYNSSTINVSRRPLDPYIDATKDDQQVQVAQCPADLGDPLNGGVPNAFKAYGTSYLPQWNSDVFRVKYVYGQTGNASRPSMTKAQITSPSNKILLGDWVWHGNRLVSERQTHWHGDGQLRQLNFLMADIHVVYLTIPTAETDVATTGTYNPAPPSPSHTYW